MLDKELIKYIKEDFKYVVYTIIFNIIGLLLSVGITALCIYAVYAFINDLFINGIYSLVFVIILGIIKFVLFQIQGKFTTTLADNVTYKLRKETYEKYLRVCNDSPFTSSEMAQLSTEGIEQLRLYYSYYLPSFFYAMIAPIILFIIFLFIDVKVAFLYLVCVPLIPMSIIMVSKWAKKIFHKYWNQYTSLGDSFLDNTNGMKELKIFSYDEIRQKEMMDKSEGFRKITMKVLTMQLASVTIMDLVAFGGAGIGIVLSLNALQNGLSIYLTLFMILIGAEFFLPMRALGSAFHVAMNGATAGKKIIKLLNVEEKEEGNINIDNISNVTLSNVCFNYKDNDKFIVNNIDMTLNKGFYSIVGLSGSGKSTLAKIINGQLNVTNGKVLFDNIDINEINKKSFYRNICYISNNTYLFHETIYDSFKFYNKNISEERMLELLDLVKMKDVINRNGGLSFKINESSSNISGGEKQRLVLAYYLAKEYDFYIFDEVTSNIDVESEEIILDVIKKISTSKIVLFISHRLKNVIDSNMIYYLEDSEIIEKGTFEMLMNLDSKFKKLYSKQVNMEVDSYEA